MWQSILRISIIFFIQSQFQSLKFRELTKTVVFTTKKLLCKICKNSDVAYLGLAAQLEIPDK